jgi:hypothetical protein
MSEKIELTDGAWAVLRKPADVPVRLRRPVEKAMMRVSQGQAGEALKSAPADLTDEARAAEIAANLDPNILDSFNELNDVLILARLESWSFDEVISLDSILNLKAGDYEILQKSVVDDVTEMIPNFGLDTAEQSPGLPSSV